jgi:hypothetical protein
MGIQKLVAAASVLLMSAGGAHALTAQTVSDTYTITLSGFTGNEPGITDHLGSSQSLTPGVPSTPTNFFTASPQGSSGLMGVDPTVTGTINVTIHYTDGALNGSVTETGLFEAKYGGTPLSGCTTSGPGDTDCIVWTGAANSPTGSATLGLTTSNGLILNTTFYNANDWSITPNISFDLDPASPTPIPAALPLFAGGLGMMGVLIRRRKRQKLLV